MSPPNSPSIQKLKEFNLHKYEKLIVIIIMFLFKFSCKTIDYNIIYDVAISLYYITLKTLWIKIFE